MISRYAMAGFGGILLLIGLIALGSWIREDQSTARYGRAGGVVAVSGLLLMLGGILGTGSNAFAIVVRWAVMALAIIFLATVSGRG